MFDELRERMVEEQLRRRGITDARVLHACARVPRHHFVPAEVQTEAYADHPLPIGHGQTISQPYMVALMTEALRLQGHERVLEIGTGSGYQLAILTELALEVYSVERVPALAERARQRVQELGYANAHIATGDGGVGWAEHAPYDAMAVTACAPRVPPALLDQLTDHGRLVIPLGSLENQQLTLIERHGRHDTAQVITGCVFVPLISPHGWPAGPVEPR